MRFPWRIHFSIGLVVLVISCLLGLNYHIANNVISRHANWLHGIYEYQLYTAESHVWLEERLEAGPDENQANIMQLLKESTFYLTVLLEGGQDDETLFVPVTDPELRELLQKIRPRHAAFVEFSTGRMSSENAGIGTELDRQYDAMYLELQEAAKDVEAGLLRLIDHEQSELRRVQLVLAFFCFFLAMASFFIFQRYENKRAKYLAAVIETKQKLAVSRDELRESEERLRLIAETIDDVFWVCDCPEQVRRFVSSAYEKIWGKTAESLYRNPADWIDSIHEDDRQRVWSAFTRMEAGALYDEEYRIVRPDGESRWIHDRGFPIRGEYGRISKAVGIAQDISKRKKAERELTRLAAAIHHAVEEIVITDLHGVIEYVNPAFEQINGYTLQEAVGKKPSLLKSGRHDDQFYKNLWRTITSGKVWTGRFVNRRKDNALIEIDATISPITDPTGEIIGFVSVKRDVTDQVRMEEQLRQSQKMEAIGTLAGGIAHDFNNILNVIMGYADLLRDEFDEGSQQYDELVEIKDAGKRATELVKQILTFSRRSQQERQPLLAQNMVKEALKFLRSSLPATIKIRQDIDLDCSSIIADHTQVYQVIMNLCTNSFHAMREQGGELTVQLDEIEVDAGMAASIPDLKVDTYVRLAVIDTGHGIDPVTMDRIFEPYFTTKKQGEGTGLGLATVHGVVKSHGGAITVDSKPGKGSTFTVYFPVAGGEEDAAQEQKQVKIVLPRLQGHLLFVDDVEANVLLGKILLAKMGCTVLGMTGSMDALEVFRADPQSFDGVITDQTMPDLTGLELARHMLAIRPDIPIIMLTGHSDIVDEELAMKTGICAFMMKPLDLDRLAGSLATFLPAAE